MRPIKCSKKSLRSGNLYDRWQQVEGQAYGEQLDHDVRASVGKVLETTHKHLKHWLPREEKGVTDPKELESIRENNRKYPEREAKFGNAFRHFFDSDRMEATKDALDMVEWSEKVPELEKKIAELEKENARLSKDNNGRNRLRNHELQPQRPTGHRCWKGSSRKTKAFKLLKHRFQQLRRMMILSAENVYRCRWNCLMASDLDDRRMMVAITALECLKLHEEKMERRREAKVMPRTFRVDFPDGWIPMPPPQLPECMNFSLWTPPPPNALDL
jgi:hypothetical protein